MAESSANPEEQRERTIERKSQVTSAEGAGADPQAEHRTIHADGAASPADVGGSASLEQRRKLKLQVSRLATLLRERSREAKAKLHQRDVELRTLQRKSHAAVAQARRKTTLIFADRVRTLEEEVVTLKSDLERMRLELSDARQRHQRDVASLEARNRSLRETAEISTARLEVVTERMLNDTNRTVTVPAECGALILSLEHHLETLQNEVTASDQRSVDNLTAIKGVGDKTAERLRAAGIDTLQDLADVDLAQLDEGHPLFDFKSRLVRDDWVGQASALLGVDGNVVQQP